MKVLVQEMVRDSILIPSFDMCKLLIFYLMAILSQCSTVLLRKCDIFHFLRDDCGRTRYFLQRSIKLRVLSKLLFSTEFADTKPISPLSPPVPLTSPPSRAFFLTFFAGSGNASRAGLERRSHAHAHDGAIPVGPEAYPLEVAGHADDGQVQAIVGPVR